MVDGYIGGFMLSFSTDTGFIFLHFDTVTTYSNGFVRNGSLAYYYHGSLAIFEQ